MKKIVDLEQQYSKAKEELVAELKKAVKSFDFEALVIESVASDNYLVENSLMEITAKIERLSKAVDNVATKAEDLEVAKEEYQD